MAHQIEKWGADKLIKRFENDILYDCHSYHLKFERSDAKKELVRRGREVLKTIIEHLHKKTPSGDLQVAWNNLLNMIEIQIDPDKTSPKDLRDTEGWISWAEKFV